ncbi:MAG: M13 family metallopeptidase [Ginsengibacter sp.]
MLRKICLLPTIGLILFSCQNPEEGEKPDVLAANIDSLANPRDDFFAYANGGWIKKNNIPADHGEWGIGALVNDENENRLKNISGQAAKNPGIKGSATQIIGDFWTAAMDSSAIENEGIKYLQPWFDKITRISDITSFLDMVAELNNIEVETLFGKQVTPDDKNSTLMSYRLLQGGIGLPDRDYYFKTDSSTVNIRRIYLKHIATMLELQGIEALAAVKSASSILSMETKLAAASRKIEDLRDPYDNYHKMAIHDLSKVYPAIKWEQFLTACGVKNVDSVTVGQPEFFKALAATINSTPIDDLKNYLRFNLVSSFAIALPNAYGEEAFNFGKLFSGVKERRPRWERIIASEENVMGELLGQLYVKQFFNDSAKKRYSDMAESIRAAYKERIEKLAWMGDTTRKKALIKLEATRKKIGFPDKWKDFSSMDIGTKSYVQNLLNAHTWWHNFQVNKLGKPVDKDEWTMFPQTYDAYYDQSSNEIVFPAAIFTVPGYSDQELDEATMYGYVGASTIGHEITHGFDDQGRLYDEKGNLNNWWTANDSIEFTKRALVIINQFNRYEPLPGDHINGKATQGENIADLGGLEIGLTAFTKSNAFNKNEIIAGFTPLQRFFLGYSLSWMYSMRDEVVKNLLMTDVHSPAKFRVNGPFSDIDEFYKAFLVKPGDKMYLPDSLRVKIW